MFLREVRCEGCWGHSCQQDNIPPGSIKYKMRGISWLIEWVLVSEDLCYMELIIFRSSNFCHSFEEQILFSWNNSFNECSKPELIGDLK